MGNVILGLLLLGPATIYALNKQFEQGVSLLYSASLGSIRSALLVLLQRELVTVAKSVDGGRAKKTYSITGVGTATFFEWMLAPIIHTNIETVALSKLFFLGLMPESQRNEILGTIVERIAADEAELTALAAHLDVMELPAEAREVFRYQRLTLEYGLLSHRTGREFFQGLGAEPAGGSRHPPV